MAKTKRISRKQLRKPDEFVVATGTAYQFLKGNRKHFIGGGIALVVLILLASGVTALVEHRRTNNYSRFIAPVGILMEANRASLGFAEGEDAEGDFSRSALVEEARLEATEFLDQHSGGRNLGHLALLTGASLHLESGEPARAEELYREFISNSSRRRNQDYLFFGLKGLALSLEDQGKLDEAASVYDNIAELDDDQYAGFAALQQGRLLVAAEDFIKARAFLTEAAEQHGDSPYGDELKTARDKLL